MQSPDRSTPRYIQIHPNDNVAIVVNDGGLPAGAVFPDGLILTTRVPQGHKVALADLTEGAPILRYNVVIGHASCSIPKGSWVEESMVRIPPACGLEHLPACVEPPRQEPPIEGHTFLGYRNTDGTVGTRNILAISTSVQCVSGVVEHAVNRIKRDLLPLFPNVDDVVGLEHAFGCGVAIDTDDANIPIRTLRNISRNPNFGGQVMLVSLGCEKLQPSRLFPEGSLAGCSSAPA